MLYFFNAVSIDLVQPLPQLHQFYAANQLTENLLPPNMNDAKDEIRREMAHRG